MRLARLELDGFRAFGSQAELDLDADAVILVGPNGCGKTSVLDGILWSLAGRVPRINGGDQALVSLYSTTGGARATAMLTGSDGNAEVRRTFDGERSSLQFILGQQETRGTSALALLCQTLWPDAAAADDEAGALTSVLTRSVYLQQDRVRQFIEADTEQERFTAVSELVGAGRVAEFQLQLDRERTAWSRATNERTSELATLRSRLSSFETRLASLADVNSSLDGLQNRWQMWWTRLSELGIADISIVPFAAAQSPQLLDDGVRRLRAFQTDRERAADQLREELAELESYLNASVPEDVDLGKLRVEVATAEQFVRDAQALLAAAEASAADGRRRQTELKDARADLQAFAQLALRHLSETCPVCAQTYDQASARARLERIVGGVSEPSIEQIPLVPDGVAAAADALQQAETTRTRVVQTLQNAEAVARSVEMRKLSLGARLEALGVDETPSLVALEQLRTRLIVTEAARTESARLQQEGEALAVDVARSAEAARKGEVQAEVDNLRSKVGVLVAEVDRRELTGRRAVDLLEGLREASSDVVKTELERVEPLLQQIFSTVDPHPAFRAVRLLTRFANRRGRVSTQLDDALSHLSTQTPEVVLSSSQLNGLAVSVFLALNLGMRALPLDALILDDPLQSLDDVNLLGLVDLMRRIRDHRQVIVSTHDPRFGELLARKLRPVNESQRTLVYRFDSWGRRGPVIEKEEIPRDAATLRIATSAA